MDSAQSWKPLRAVRVLRKRTYLLGICNVSYTRLGTWDAEVNRPNTYSPVLIELTGTVGKQKRRDLSMMLHALTGMSRGCENPLEGPLTSQVSCRPVLQITAKSS